MILSWGVYNTDVFHHNENGISTTYVDLGISLISSKGSALNSLAFFAFQSLCILHFFSIFIGAIFLLFK